MRAYPRFPFLMITALALPVLALASACDYRGPVGDDLAVQPIVPINGAAIPLVAQTTGVRPVFRWTATPAATRFEIQVDDSCTSTLACTFPSPEIDETNIATSTYTATHALVVGTSASVARRYYWRVRPCQGSTCGGWSPVRYVVIGGSSGPLNTDLNGDGYEDAVVSAPASSTSGQQSGSVYVYLGGPSVSVKPALVLNQHRALEWFGANVAMVGDVNGDGFGDYLVRSQGDESTPGVAPAAHAYIYFGGVTLRNEADIVLDCTTDNGDGATAGIGDVNGDGYDDIAMGGVMVDAAHQASSSPRVDIHFGGPAMTNATDLTLLGDITTLGGDFGSSIAAAGDVNADGYPDFVVGAEASEQVSVYFGGPGLDAIPNLTLRAPPDAPGDQLFGVAVAGVGDFNGDGVADLAVGAPGTDASVGPLGHVYVYYGGASLGSAPDVTLTGTNQGDWFGKQVVGTGDVDGDGVDDIVAMTPGVDGARLIIKPTPADSILRVDVFFGGKTPNAQSDLTFQAGPATFETRGLAVRDLDGDSRPDLLVGSWSTDAGADGIGAVDVFLGARGAATPPYRLSGLAAGDRFGQTIGR